MCLLKALHARRGGRKTKARPPQGSFPKTSGKWDCVCSVLDVAGWAQTVDLGVCRRKNWHFPCFSWCSGVKPWGHDNCCSADCKKLVQSRDGKTSHFCSLKKSPVELTVQSLAASVGLHLELQVFWQSFRMSLGDLVYKPHQKWVKPKGWGCLSTLEYAIL